MNAAASGVAVQCSCSAAKMYCTVQVHNRSATYLVTSDIAFTASDTSVISLHKLLAQGIVHLQLILGTRDNILCCKLGLQGGADLQGCWCGQTHGRAGCKGVLKGLQQPWSQLYSQQPLTDLYISSIKTLLDSTLQIIGLQCIRHASK